MFERYDFLGANYPSYRRSEGGMTLHNKIVNSYNDNYNNEIDAVSIMEYINYGWVLGDRTMIKGVYRVPWLSKPSEIRGWHHASINKTIIDDNEDPTNRIIEKTLNELRDFTAHKKIIGILLSGGMDSRVCAAMLNKLVKIGDYCGSIVGITWGVDGCRDVEYSKRICKTYGWENLRLPINAELLFKNIQYSVDTGAMVSPIHFHNMDGVRKLEGIDGIIAASYGDSMGRAEYSGKHVSKLKDLSQISQHNHYNIMNDNVFQQTKAFAKEDIREYFYRKERWEDYIELDYQAFYMRNKLQVCLNYIEDKIPLHQLFTSPDVYSYVLSLNHQLRGDKLYENILKRIAPELLLIPWSRTGITYGTKNKNPDQLAKNFHEYHLWIRKDLREEIEKLVFSNEVDKLKVFNMEKLKILFNVYPRYSGNYVVPLDEIFIWIASISKLSKQYNVSFDEKIKHTCDKPMNFKSKVIFETEFKIKENYKKLYRRIGHIYKKIL
ncbi:asparagine synthase-related protein [Paenibacillus sp. J5C_2022]|uniref:asparagine synthase-related protein n=1 Tax=Paenibacillus sp. J5C2022 TaxID=2977129 RepID=UPI0021CE5F4B|nr:asparagine synthase-related protein [Paenibacillus sp. J5C2022]MCU6708775.1 asparagine synthase-related protein [Paenibacillus sp. J5C2022]